METRTRGKGTIDCGLRGSVGTLADANPTRLSKWSQSCPLTPPVEPLEFHSVDPSTVPYVDDNLDWVDALIPVPTPVFQTPSVVTDHNPINNQLVEALRQFLENFNRGSVPKPHQSKAHWWGSKGIWSQNKDDNKWKSNNPWDVSQLCTRQVGTGEVVK